MVPFIQTANDLSVALFVLIYQGSKAMHVIAGNELVDEVTHSRIRDEENEKSKNRPFDDDGIRPSSFRLSLFVLLSTMNSFIECTTRIYMNLPPCFSHDIRKGIHAKLDSMLFKLDRR